MWGFVLRNFSLEIFTVEHHHRNSNIYSLDNKYGVTLEDKYVHGTEKHSTIAKAVWNLSITVVFKMKQIMSENRWQL